MVKRILVTGATGYIGGLLIPYLLQQRYSVRVFVRNPEPLHQYEWFYRVEVFSGDALKPETLKPAMEGVDAAYYLIHSMTARKNYTKIDYLAAKNFGTVANEHGLQQIIYLGGLGNAQQNLSSHLHSRQETGRILRNFDVAVTEFRAAIIIGSGSMSFEMIRALTNRLPVMICPKWVFTKVQPIAVEDVLQYLTAAIFYELCYNEVIEIGGTDVMTYAELMKSFARLNGKRRWLISVPVLTPALSAYWVHWVTPVPASYAHPLIQSLQNEVIVIDDKAQKLFSDICPMTYEQAVLAALRKNVK